MAGTETHPHTVRLAIGVLYKNEEVFGKSLWSSSSSSFSTSRSISQGTLGETGLTLTAKIAKTSTTPASYIAYAYLTGTPTTEGTFTGTVTYTNSSSSVFILKLTVVIEGLPPTITTGTLPDGTKGAAYSQTVEATGSPTITFSIISGSLPPGLTLDPDTGVISGTIE